MEFKKSKNLLYIENCFQYILEGADVERNLTSIRATLNREFKEAECVEIMYTKTNITRNFFGMRIFPSDKALEILAKEVMSKDTPNVIKHYIIEIDSKLFDKELGLTAGELTAIILHEFGHIVNNSYVQREVQSTFRMYTIQADKDKAFNPQAYCYMYKLLYLTILDRYSRFNIYRSNIKHESLADKFAITRGYGRELDSAFHKIITRGYHVFKTEKKGTLYIWSIQNMIAIGERRRIIAQELDTELKRAENPYIERIIKEMIKMINDSNSELTEAMGYHSIYMEKEVIREDKEIEIFIEGIFKPNFTLKAKDYDLLSVEVDMVEDYHEKIEVLEKIHLRLKRVNKYLDKKRLSDADKEYLIDYRNKMLELQKRLMSKKILDKEYGVFVKYPTGYEG